MSTVTAINPIMQPVTHNGQTYYTHHYFHQMYRNNSDMGGKYNRAGDFMRLIRSIETYQNYIDAGDIVELEWGAAKESGDANIASLIKSNSYKALMLINATAQVALTHHLDDEVSKKVSVAVNQQVADEAKRLTAADAKAAKEIFALIQFMGKTIGTELQMVNVLAVDKVQQITGLDMSPLLAGNAVTETPLTPTELGKELGISAKAMNIELEQAGFQQRNASGDWFSTENGKQFCTVNPYKSQNSEHTGYRVLWYKRVPDVLTAAA